MLFVSHLLSEAAGARPVFDNLCVRVCGVLFSVSILALTVPFLLSSNIESRKRPRFNFPKPMVSDADLFDLASLFFFFVCVWGEGGIYYIKQI